MFVEWVWCVVFLFLIVIVLFVGVFWVGLWFVLFVWVGMVGVFLFLIVVVIVVWDILWFVWLICDEVFYRVEIGFDYKYWLLIVLEDELMVGSGDLVSEVIWVLYC